LSRGGPIPGEDRQSVVKYDVLLGTKRRPSVYGDENLLIREGRSYKKPKLEDPITTVKKSSWKGELGHGAGRSLPRRKITPTMFEALSKGL